MQCRMPGRLLLPVRFQDAQVNGPQPPAFAHDELPMIKEDANIPEKHRAKTQFKLQHILRNLRHILLNQIIFTSITTVDELFFPCSF